MLLSRQHWQSQWYPTSAPFSSASLPTLEIPALGFGRPMRPQDLSDRSRPIDRAADRANPPATAGSAIVPAAKRLPRRPSRGIDAVMARRLAYDTQWPLRSTFRRCTGPTRVV